METVSLTTLAGLDLFAMLGAVLWYALRVGAALQVLPVVGGRGIPARARLITTLALSAAMAARAVMPPPMADAATVRVLREFCRVRSDDAAAGVRGAPAGELSAWHGPVVRDHGRPLERHLSPVLSQWFYWRSPRCSSSSTVTWRW